MTRSKKKRRLNRWTFLEGGTLKKKSSGLAVSSRTERKKFTLTAEGACVVFFFHWFSLAIDREGKKMRGRKKRLMRQKKRKEYVPHLWPPVNERETGMRVREKSSGV